MTGNDLGDRAVAHPEVVHRVDNDLPGQGIHRQVLVGAEGQGHHGDVERRGLGGDPGVAGPADRLSSVNSEPGSRELLTSTSSPAPLR